MSEDASTYSLAVARLQGTDDPTRAVKSCQILADSPTYVLPCPLCTIVGVEGCPDYFRYPSVTRSRHTGKFHFAGHAIGCTVCSDFNARADTEAEICAAWLTHVATFLHTRTTHRDHAIVARRLQRLQSRGRVPTSFPMPVGA